jgi:hypothetical protein
MDNTVDRDLCLKGLNKHLRTPELLWLSASPEPYTRLKNCTDRDDLAPVQIIYVRLSGVKLVFGRRLSALIVLHGSRAFGSEEASKLQTLAL